MKISQRFIQESVIVLTVLMLTLSNGLFKRPFIFLFLIILTWFLLNKPSNVRFSLDLIKKSIPLLLVFTWCFITSFWSQWPKTTLYELIWQILLYCYVVAFIVSFLSIDCFKVIRFATYVWVGLTLLFVFKNDIAHGRIIEISGAFANKNNLGPIIGCMIFYIIFSTKRWNLINSLVLFGVFLILIMTFSKTSIGTTLIILLLSWIFNLGSNSLNRITRFLVYTPVRIVFWFFAIIIPLWIIMNYNGIFSLLYTHLQDDWLTGRGRLWLVMLNQSYGNLLYGLGYASVWGLGDYNLIQNTELATYAVEWVDKLAASDGGYIDIFIAIGGVGLSLVVFMIFDFYKTYFRIMSLGLSDKFTTLAFCIGTFSIINNITETTFLLAASFSWFNFIFAYLLLKTKVLIDIEKKYE